MNDKEAPSFQHAQLIEDADISKMADILKRHKLTFDEYKVIKNIIKRAPTYTELGVFSAMWSEHCSYKSSKVHLKRFPTTGKNVVVGPGENAGIVRLDGKLCVAFKMESHNHPSYLEPYQGAATGVGGIMRDVFCMGARPVANLNCLRFGERSHFKTSYLLEKVVKGIGDYGNCIGVPTVGGNVGYDASYNGNCLVNAMTVGVIEEDKIFKGNASGIGNLVIYVGSSTGRDGIHGATMASVSFDSSEKEERSAVQVGDPFMEKLLMEATLSSLEKGLVVGLQDMGAAGLISSSVEMASRAGNGLYIDLDAVPVRAENMTAYELLLSESQERMVMVIKPENWEKLVDILEKWQLQYSIIGSVVNTGRLQISYKNTLEVDLPVGPLTENAPKYNRPVNYNYNYLSGFDKRCEEKIKKSDHKKLAFNIINDAGDKEEIYLQYDHHIGTKTVLGPEGDGAAALWLKLNDEHNKNLGLAIATSCNERYCGADPKLGAAYAVLKSAHMITALGGEPLAITDCLNYGNPEDPAVMGEFALGVDGISLACDKLGIPVVSGNVSFYNETDGKSILPTPMIGMVGKIADITKAKGAMINDFGPCSLYLLQGKSPSYSYGGSLAAKVLGMDFLSSPPPPINWDAEIEGMEFLKEIIFNNSKITAVRDIGSGGVVVGILKMLKGWGFKYMDGLNQKDLLFYEASGQYLIASSEDIDWPVLKYNEIKKIGDVIEKKYGITIGQIFYG